MQIEIAIIAAFASFAGAWIAARLAFARFSREKVWERKAVAYRAIFDALHHIGRWYEKHYESALTREELDDDKTKILKDAANAAEEELERTLGSETWLLPVQCRTRLEKMAIDLKSSKHKHNNWQEFLDDGCFIIKTATGDVRTMVVEDLGLKRKWYDLL